MHTHLAGKSNKMIKSSFLKFYLSFSIGTRVTTNLVRNDTLLGPLFDDINYDFNYQYTQEIPPTKLYPVIFKNKKMTTHTFKS